MSAINEGAFFFLNVQYKRHEIIVLFEGLKIVNVKNLAECLGHINTFSFSYYYLLLSPCLVLPSPATSGCPWLRRQVSGRSGRLSGSGWVGLSLLIKSVHTPGIRLNLRPWQ